MQSLFVRRYVSILSALCLLSCGSPSPESESGPEPDIYGAIPVDDCMTFAGERLLETVGDLMQIDPALSGQPSKAYSMFPRFTNADGMWETTDSSAWSSGFFAGCLWLMYEYTSDDEWKRLAESWTAAMEREKTAGGNHNLGFKMMPGFGHGFRLTGSEHYREVLIESARTLAGRFNDTVGLIKANEMEQWKYPVMVDTMVNIELLFRAAEYGGDPAWADMAETHALNTFRHHVRGDGGTVQVVDFDPATGEVIAHDTLCGLSGDSAWARGQGQAIYGFTAAYRCTKNPELLKAAETVADFFIDNLPADYIPYWDFSDPAIPNTIRDASAAAVAVDGLIELGSLSVDPAKKKRYSEAAVNILTSLCSDGYLIGGTDSRGIVGHATWKKPSDPQADTSLIWGDYNFIEALMRCRRGI